VSVLAPGRSSRLSSSASLEQARGELALRLNKRRGDIEQAVQTRVVAIADPVETASPEYLNGLRAAVGAALEYGVAIVRLGEKRSPPVPAILLTQARIAARNGVNLDTVLRRYFGGYTLLCDFLIEEAESDELLRGSPLKSLLRTQAALFDRLIAAVSEEYGREIGGRPATAEEHRAECVRKLLAGELVDTSELTYELDAWHLGMLLAGSGASEAIRDLLKPLDGRLLIVSGGEETVLAWLGGRRRFDPAELERLASSALPAQISLAIGEPGEDLAGWRLTHRQARAALQVVMHSSRKCARYADVALLASAMQDDLLATSLRELYLKPLEQERDGGAIARQTLRTYIAAERNVTSAAAALDINRNTVANRLRTIEARIGRPLSSCVAGLDVALCLEELGERSRASKT
jgi:PucR C-terminal helix-turn-helix domain/GGDEF-like domain